MCHAHQHARRRGGAGQNAGKHADQCAEVNGHAERSDAGSLSQVVQRACGFAQLSRFAAKTKHFRVRAQHEKNASENRALQHGARNGVERIARFATQRGCAFKTNEAEHRKHKRRSERGERGALQVELVHVDMHAESDRHKGKHKDNQADGTDFDPEHQFGRKFHVSKGNKARSQTD